jgi:hypothetical protein
VIADLRVGKLGVVAQHVINKDFAGWNVFFFLLSIIRLNVLDFAAEVFNFAVEAFAEIASQKQDSSLLFDELVNAFCSLTDQ